MPNRPIDFRFTSDVVRLLNGLNKAELSVEDLEQAFVEASNSSADLERKINRATREAEKDVEKLERAVRQIPDATDDMADKAKRDFDKVGDNARDAGAEVGDEFKQNLGESLASGDLEDLFVDTMGGLVASLKGPVGAVAGVFAGIAALAFQAVKQEAENMKGFVDAQVGAMESLYEQGVIHATNLEKLQAFNQFLTDSTEQVDKLGDAFERAGVPQDEYLANIFEGGGALEDQRAKLRQIIAQNQVIVGHGDRQRTNSNATATAAERLLRYLESSAEETGTLAGNQSEIAEASRLYADRLGLVDANYDRIIDDTDLTAENVARQAAETQRIKDMLANWPKRVETEMRFYTTGAGASLIDPKSVGYSPGHVAIANMYANQQREP